MSRKIKLMKGNNIELLKTLPENSIDSVVTDPPYGLSFMGKKWDYDVPSVEFWKEVYRVLKPGGHVLSFGGTRTYHRMVVNMEDAGFEIRDQIMWLYGSGFPKSHNIGKAVDKVQGNERETKGIVKGMGSNNTSSMNNGGIKQDFNPEYELTKGNSEWEGWGTALKPANEPICMARKPLSEKTVVDNVLKWRTGGINIDGCRVGNDIIETTINKGPGDNGIYGKYKGMDEPDYHEGRFPANIILDEEAGRVLDEQSGVSKSTANQNYKWNNTDCEANTFQSRGKYTPRDDKGGASRFFYCPKVSKKERNTGCDELEEKVIEGRDPGQDERNVAFKNRPTPKKNTHPTVKPIELMAYLCRLITPPNGVVLDPFMGSGSTGMAAVREGFRFCGMEMESEYFTIAEKRILWSETANS